jgi:hypothetical protein
MTQLYQHIQEKVSQWRQDGYPSPDYPAIAEILNFATLPDSNLLRFLRGAQIRALETYWYLRIVENTPHIYDLYEEYFPRPGDRMEALGLVGDDLKDIVIDEGLDTLIEKIKSDANFVKQFKLESVHETLTLDYPSYIFALAMGTGKTILIGAIIATEFAMALEYHPGKTGPFIQNALVFAPGLTIIESLRELADLDFSRILPPRLLKPFEASYKLIFTREGEQDIPVIRGSRYNLIVTNTEKIRIQKRAYRHQSWSSLYAQHMEEEYSAEANLRLRAVASLPNLGLFSDEAHHTYGKEMDQRLKRVRQTVDYLHENTNIIAVVNTTGTPYYQRQLLKDVVIWYGLSEGIADDILKSVEDNIYAYDFSDGQTAEFVAEVVMDFFTDYGEVSLPNGSPAKLAMYFPQTKDLQRLRPVIETTLMDLGYPLDIVLRNTNQSTEEEIRAFNRLNDPASRHRVIILVNKGTEGWDCPSLFACALARKLKTSNNFVLQAASRCLRQVPGNNRKARIYLSMDNRGALDQQLQETYGESVADLEQASQNTRTTRLIIRKLEIPPLVIKKTIRQVVLDVSANSGFHSLQKPEIDPEVILERTIYTPSESPTSAGALTPTTVSEDRLEGKERVIGSDPYQTATTLAALYRLPVVQVYRELRRLYGAQGIVPATHLGALQGQIEAQTQNYRLEEEEVEVALALIKVDGFDQELDDEGNRIYTTEITYHKSREHLLLRMDEIRADNPNGFGFHYHPYNFDSKPEISFFDQVVGLLNVNPEDIEDIYFTGGLSDPAKTDFFVEYKGEDGRWHNYSPDFLVRRRDGRCYIVEIKAENQRTDLLDGEQGKKAMAVRGWERLNPDLLHYEMIFSHGDEVGINQLRQVNAFIEGKVNHE